MFKFKTNFYLTLYAHYSVLKQVHFISNQN